MTKITKKPIFKDRWCFALINNRLAEIAFAEECGIYGYCYIKREECSKREQQWIDKDIQKHQFSYRKKVFRDKINSYIFPLGKLRTD